MGPIAICAIFKDEAPDLLEWIAYHLSIDFDHIVLFDNGSTDGGAELVAASPFRQFVTIIDWPQRPGQLPAYKYFCDHFAKFFAWAAFIDIDEFIHPLQETSIKAVLPRYGGVSGVQVQWLTFASSGHLGRPPGLVLENYTMRLPGDHERCLWVKPIVRPADILDVSTGPHFFDVTGELCNTRGEIVPPQAGYPPCHDIVVINHYFTKSQEDWDGRYRRGGVVRAEVGAHYLPREFEEHDRAATVRDDRIMRFVAQVRRALGSDIPASTPHAPAATETATPRTHAQTDDLAALDETIALLRQILGLPAAQPTANAMPAAPVFLKTEQAG
jgi:hypothetical protein